MNHRIGTLLMAALVTVPLGATSAAADHLTVDPGQQCVGGACVDPGAAKVHSEPVQLVGTVLGAGVVHDEDGPRLCQWRVKFLGYWHPYFSLDERGIGTSDGCSVRDGDCWPVDDFFPCEFVDEIPLMPYDAVFPPLACVYRAQTTVEASGISYSTNYGATVTQPPC